MKRREFIRTLEKAGCQKIRAGKHVVYSTPGGSRILVGKSGARDVSPLIISRARSTLTREGINI